VTFPRFTIEQFDQEFYTSQFGMALVGLAANRYTTLASLSRASTRLRPLRASPLLMCCDVIWACSARAKAILKRSTRSLKMMRFFAAALGVKDVPSPETLRQRMDKIAHPAQWIVNFYTIALLKKAKTARARLPSGHMLLDQDVFTQDNSNTQKEGVTLKMTRENDIASEKPEVRRRPHWFR